MNNPSPEFTHTVGIDKIPAHGLEKHLVARDKEKTNLAKRFDLIDLTKLEAELNVEHDTAIGGYLVSGNLVADVVQKCVVTLEPVPAHIEKNIETLFVAVKNGEEPESYGADDLEIEPLVNGIIDLGELVAQNLGIALDPYPRKIGIEFEKPPIDNDTPRGPLADLLNLKKP